jgi:heme A synthase
MSALRRLGLATLVLAFGQIVFGAIVRITGSGMGCGDHWPKCQGHWFPPLDRADLINEVTHRYIAATLSAAVVAFVLLAFLRRKEPGVGGEGGVLRPALAALVLVLTAAIFGAATVFLELENKAVIVTHLGIAMTLLAVLTAAVLRAGSRPDAWQSTSPVSARGAGAAAALAFVALILGALTAHVPGANTACAGFPLCAGGLVPTDPSQHLQFTHRLVAFALVFHVGAVAFATRRRDEHPAARWALLSLSVIVAQILVAAVMVELHLPAIWRSLHEAVGTLVWVVLFAFAYQAWRGAWTRAPRTSATDDAARRRAADGVRAEARA